LLVGRRQAEPVQRKPLHCQSDIKRIDVFGGMNGAQSYPQPGGTARAPSNDGKNTVKTRFFLKVG
jgi:hypothetical protein